MKRSLGIALALSALLIGGASWFRFASAERLSPTITVVNSGSSEISPTESDTGTDAVLPPSLPAPKNDTELVSQQIFSDYMNLTLTGEATGENLTKLASVYATNIGGLHKAPRLLLTDLTIVDDTREAYDAYAASLTYIYATYQSKIAQALSGGKIDTSGKAVTSFALALESLYQMEAEALRGISVPREVSNAHLRLINAYLSNAAAFKALANSDQDPASAYAGIVQQKKNGEEEKQAIAEIDRILTKHGL